MYQEISLDTIFNGALSEKFEYELSKVKENLADINTSHGKMREISIKIKFAVNEERNKLLTNAEITSKLAPVKGMEGVLSFVQERGKLGIFQETAEQKPMFPEEEKNENEIDIKEVINQ